MSSGEGFAPSPTFLARLDLAQMDRINSNRLEPLSGSRVLSGRENVAMADRAGLGFVGFMFGGLTAAVMLMAVTIVVGHVAGRLVLDASPTEFTAHQ
jgi:hypothetical protein